MKVSENSTSAIQQVLKAYANDVYDESGNDLNFGCFVLQNE